MDYKLLLIELKKHGLDLAEDAARDVVEAVFSWLETEVVKTENKIDDLLVAILPVIKPHILKAIDKIDGQEG